MKTRPCGLLLFALSLGPFAGAADAAEPKASKTIACELVSHACEEYAADSAQALERHRKDCEDVKGHLAASCSTKDRVARCTTHPGDSVLTTYVYSYGRAEQDARMVAGFKSACDGKKGTFEALH